MIFIWFIPLLIVLTLMFSSLFVRKFYTVELWLAEDIFGGFSAHNTFYEAYTSYECREVTKKKVRLEDDGSFTILE